MKCFRNVAPAPWPAHKHPTGKRGLAAILLVAAIVVSVGGAAAEWRNAESGSALEDALYRWMPMPVSRVLGLRPPKEATPLLSELIKRQPTAELYSLRALNEEAALDFAAAESDWKKYVEVTPDRLQAQWDLADFYLRRLRPEDEIAALAVIGRAPASAAEKLAPSAPARAKTARAGDPAEQQASWLAFERIFKVIGENTFAAEVSEQNYRAWLDRYPQAPGVYSRYFQFLLDHKSFAAAEKLIARYQTVFPKDEIFPVKARALLEYKKGSIEQGLAIYDVHFQPLWPQELLDSYFALLTETRSLRNYLDRARGDLEKNPDNLNAAARIFYFYQRQGRTDAAQQTLVQYRARKEQRNARWTSAELYTLAKLNEGIKNYPEAARYYYALYSSAGSSGAPPPQQANIGLPADPETALAGLANVLLDAPEQNIRVGSGSLSMYQDVAAMDRGPGFLNGILSLVMNSTSPPWAYSEEELRAVPYFHRAEAAQLIRLFDERFPRSQQRAGLHARLAETYSAYGESGAVIREGRQFLTAFPDSPERERVALVLADAYARDNRTEEEFALYDSELAELAQKCEGVPIGMKAGPTFAPPRRRERADSTLAEAESESENLAATPVEPQQSRAFSTQAPAGAEAPKSPQAWYADFLERYLSRLASMEQVPEALAVLRREIDRNPNDPGLYERLAQFLQQNRLGQQQEQVYERAIQQFPDRSWYQKLARFYLRYKRDADFSRLSEQVIKIFSGTELEAYFSDVVSGSQYYLRLNEFAHARFPHDLLFSRNLMNAYKWSRPPQMQKWEDLIRQHWWEADDLRNEYFEYLSQSGRLEQEVAALEQLDAAAKPDPWSEWASRNPVAARFAGEAAFWRSHYEAGAPVMNALAQQYPADFELGRRASAVYRSLAAFDPHDTEIAVAIEENLYRADPGNRDTLARIGDILADREWFGRAAAYWNRIPQVRPGEPQAYLDAATIYWDYYDFDSALRLIDEGRSKLGDATLYAYEAGAIYEGERDYPRAIAEYVKGALREHEGSRPYDRLLDLARRKSRREDVERATAPLVERAAPGIDAIKLRVAVLEAENRSGEVEALLAAACERSNSLDLLEWLETTARQKSLGALQEKVLEKQAAATTDPVRKLELRYSLVRFYETKKDVPQAQRNIEALYRENPKILGVVRSTVDFYWQNQERQRAIDVLLQAANDAYPALATQFHFEAARKATEAGQYEKAQGLLAQLLAVSPYSDEYLAAMADTYARAGDDRGLKKFYLEKIEEFRKAALSPEVRTRQVAALRRGLIPALDRLKDFSGAVDQYIEIVNRYPEDDALISEAARYAQRNGRQSQLLDYYSNTAKQSPHDYRWPMALAKMQAQMESYAAAVEAYATAVSIRPDRVDLRTARAELLERLMRFEEAAAEYQKLFDLNYHDARWMVKVAEIRARQGRTADTVAALDTALLANRPEKPSNFFEVARRLEGWGMLSPAREYAQKGVDSAGRDLLAVSENHEGATLYVRIMTRLRQQAAAYSRLQSAVADADSIGAAVAVTANQVEKNGIVSITDQQWRSRALDMRRETAAAGMLAAMEAMGKSAGQYFTPEEKAQFASWLEGLAAPAGNDQVAAHFLPAATAAGLPDLQARWLKQLMLSDSAGPGSRFKSQLVELQTSRLRFQELGDALQAYAQQLTMEQGRNQVLVEAADTYRSGGLYDAEFNLLKGIAVQGGGEPEQRYFELLLQRDPQELVRLAGRSGERGGDAACQYLVAKGPENLAQEAVAARGRSRQPVWSSAYSALVGLNFSDHSAAVNAAFVGALGDATIGERLGKPVDRERQLAGTIWFYYGARYGEWLGMSRTGDPEDFLPALLEESPATAAGYVTVAEYYADSGKIDRALDDYNRALELAPARADLHDRAALLYWRQQKRAEAVAEWQKALELLDAQVHQRAVPPGFWATFGYVMNHTGNRHVAAELRPQSDAVLRDYIRQNGVYRALDLLQAGYTAIGDRQAGVSFLLDLTSVAPEPISVLQLLARADWIPAAARDPVYERILAQLRDRIRGAEELSKDYAELELRSWQVRYAGHLVEQKEFDRAAAVLESNENPSEKELQIRYRIALAKGQFDAILEQYRANPDQAPKPYVLRQVAMDLQLAGERAAASKILEFLFAQEIAAHQLSAANMLGLAEIRLQDGDTAGAMELLRRLALVVGQPFENLEPAATLLSRNGRHAEALEFLSQLVKAEPWNEDARLHLSQEQLAAGQDKAAANALAASIAADAQSTFADRLAAAAVLSGSEQKTGQPSLGSGVLDFIAYGVGSPDKPYSVAAWLSAAKKGDTLHATVQMLQNALADAPDRDAFRVPLFYALAQLKQDRLALSDIEPLLRKGYLQTRERRSGASSRFNDQSTDTEETDAAETDTSENAEPVVTSATETPSAERGELAAAVARSYANLGELETALRYYRTALSLQTANEAKAETQKKINGIRAGLRRQAENALRMPVIHQELEQQHLVRPRLVAANASPPAKTGHNATEGGTR